jgi:hypothetical protein
MVLPHITPCQLSSLRTETASTASLPPHQHQARQRRRRPDGAAARVPQAVPRGPLPLQERPQVPPGHVQGRVARRRQVGAGEAGGVKASGASSLAVPQEALAAAPAEATTSEPAVAPAPAPPTEPAATASATTTKEDFKGARANCTDAGLVAAPVTVCEGLVHFPTPPLTWARRGSSHLRALLLTNTVNLIANGGTHSDGRRR